MSFDDQVSAAVAQLRSHGAVAVLGAGLSAPRYPMTAELRALLWHALDSVPAARARLAAELGVDDKPGKTLVDDDAAAVERAWQSVEDSPALREAVQHAFVRLDAIREPTPAHYAVARLVQAGIIEYVVSFNWDTALERAHEQLFGTTLTGRADILAKPHGDAAAPDEKWILPHQPGEVTQPILARMARLVAERPRVLLVVGYSSSDAAVVEELVGPAERRWPVVRVGPSASGPETITGFADDVMPVLADKMNAPVDLVGWRWVAFTRSRDLRAALMGYRLGPQDVEACPALPATPSLVERLRRTHFAVIVGESGAGKSITAFHAARELNRDGWSVVELSQPGVANRDVVRAFTAAPGPVLAVVDDAQALSVDVLHELERAVSDDHAVILVETERSPGHELVRVSATSGVAVLTEYCKTHSDVVEPLVSEIDDRVGLGISQEPFDRRLEVASSSEYPWQFMYVLGGGERRIASALTDLAERGSAHVLLGILAATQLLSVDAGATREVLNQHAGSVGFSEDWVDAATVVLTQNRLVVDRNERLRTPHLRLANRALLVLCRNEHGSLWREFVAFLGARLGDVSESLQGILWLLRAIDQADPLRYRHRKLLLNAETTQLLVNRSLDAPAGPDRNIAAYLLWELGWWHALSRAMAEQIAMAVPAWIAESTSDDVFGIQWLLGGLRANFSDLRDAISARVKPELVARRLAEHGSADTAESWGRMIGELSHAEGVDREEWAARFEDALDTDALVFWIERERDAWSLRGVVHLVNDLAGLVPRVASIVVTAAAPALSERIEHDPASASHELTPWAFGVFALVGSQNDAFWSAHDDYRLLRDAVLGWVNTTDWRTVGSHLSEGPLHQTRSVDLLLYSISHIAPAAYEELVSGVSLDEFDQLTAGHWRDFSGIEHLVVGLGQGPNREPARSWVHRHVDEIHEFPTRVIPIAPADAAEVLHRGGRVILEVQAGLRWDWCADATNALLDFDRDAAGAVLQASRADIVEGLELRQTNMTAHLDRFVSALDAFDPTLLRELLEELDTEVARQFWTARLNGTDEEAAAVRLLLDRASGATGEVAALAQDLLATEK